MSSARDGNVLEGTALEHDGDAGGGGKSPRPQGRIDGPRLVHGLWESLERPAERRGNSRLVRCSDGLSQVNSGRPRDYTLNRIR